MKDKKIALCLYGYSSNKHVQNSYQIGYEHIKKNILIYEPDVYIHSWEPHLKQENFDKYRPKEAIYEEQIDFSNIINFDRYVKGYNFNLYGYELKGENTLSFLYSRNSVLELALDSAVKYDIIMVCRFDVGTIDAFNDAFQFKVSLVKFCPYLPMDNVYLPFWNQFNNGFPDQWFYSSPENMNVLYNMEEKVKEYFTKDSSYEKALKAWPDSKPYNVVNFYDTNQFTNEMLLPENKKSRKLMKFELGYAIDNHKLHKWFFIDQGLYNKVLPL